MRYRRSAVPPRWLPFVGRRLGLAKSLSHLSVDLDDFNLHHVFPSATALGRLLGDPREFEPRAGGAGILLDASIDRAMGELLERYAALAFGSSGRTVGSYRALDEAGRRLVPIETLTLFSAEQLAAKNFPYTGFAPDTPVGWFEGVDLASDSPILIPGQLVSLGYVPGADEVPTCFYASSSGCALARSVAAALVAGLLECIERDAVMMRWYARLAPPRLGLDPADLLGRRLGGQAGSLEVRFLDMTVDGEVPVVGVSCIERTGRPCFFILSAAAALDTPAAAHKALIEAGQGRPFIKFLANLGGPLGAGDKFADFDSNVRFFAEPSNAGFVEWFSQNPNISSRNIPPIPSTADPTAALAALVERCRSMALTPIAFDLSTPELRDHGLFACRVFIPELVPLSVPFAPFLGHPRLAHFIRLAERNGAGASVPNWVPHPFP